MQLQTAIEAVLAGSGKPFSFEAIGRLVDASKEDVEEAVRALKNEYEMKSRGIRIITNGRSAEFATAPECAELVQKVINDERAEMTQAQIETLAILGYMGPLSRAELENIRGVNCAIIIKNLQIEGLIETYSASSDKHLYCVTTSFLKGLGVGSVEQLPEYQVLRQKITTLEEPQ